MNYNDFLAQKSIYDKIIEQRLPGYLEIAQNERHIYTSNTEKMSTYFTNGGATEYLTKGADNEHIDYDAEIELEFDIHYSGCGTDTYTIYLPDWILLENDDEYKTALNDYADSIQDKNAEIEHLKEEEKKQEVKIKKDSKEAHERKEYERLKKMFGQDK